MLVSLSRFKLSHVIILYNIHFWMLYKTVESLVTPQHKMPWNIIENEFEETMPYGLEDLELLSGNFFAVGVPRELPDEFRKRVFGAAKSFELNHKSVDYTIKKFGDYWQIYGNNDNDKILNSLCMLVRQYSKNIIKYLVSIPNKPDKPNIFACSAAIFRLINTFHGAILCVSQKLHFEAALLSRMILEQLSWMYTICHLDEDFEKVINTEPQKTFSNLKRLIPEAGKGYGIRSSKSHLVFKETLNYIDAKDNLNLKLKDTYKSANDALNLLILVDWLGIVGEYIYFNLLDTPNFTVKEKGKAITPNPERSFLEVIKEGKGLVGKIKQKKDKGSNL